MEQQEAFAGIILQLIHYPFVLLNFKYDGYTCLGRRMSLFFGTKYGMMGHHVDNSQVFLRKKFLIVSF